MEYGIRDSEFFYKEFDLNQMEFKKFVTEHFQKRLCMKNKLRMLSKSMKDDVKSSYSRLLRSIESQNNLCEQSITSTEKEEKY